MTHVGSINTTFVAVVLWQGQKDSNPRHAVLETAALPAELYPYLALEDSPIGERPYSGGPSGTRTQDQPVMSRPL